MFTFTFVFSWSEHSLSMGCQHKRMICVKGNVLFTMQDDDLQSHFVFENVSVFQFKYTCTMYVIELRILLVLTHTIPIINAALILLQLYRITRNCSESSHLQAFLYNSISFLSTCKGVKCHPIILH